MTEERIKKLLKSRYNDMALGALFAVTFIGIVLSIFGGPTFFLVGIMCGLFFYFKIKIENRSNVKDLDSSLLFIIYPDKETLIKVMDEVIDHPIFRANGTKISKHFILYGDQYENIIRLYDVTGINITELDIVYSRILIEDRFGQKKKIKIETPKAKEIYDYLSENCVNAVVGAEIVLDDEDSNPIFIEYDSKLTEEYCFYEADTKKTKSSKKLKENKKEEIKEEQVEVKEEQVKEIKNEKKESNKSSDMDQKYNDLKKLKELLDNDIITKEDYDKEKAKILSD